MFKNYNSIADIKAPIKTEEKQAHLHGELVHYLHQLNTILVIDDLQDAYNKITEKLSNVFINNRNYSPISEELNAMINEKADYYSYSYKTMRYDGHYSFTFNNNGMESVRSHNKSLINTILLEIGKKELYIDYLLNDTEENREKVRVQDTVVKCNKYLNSNLAGSDLYDLTYTNADSLVSDKTVLFAHDVISMSDSIRTKPQIYIDKTWCTNVYDKNLHVLEFEGARAFTLKCEWLDEDEEKCIYDTQVLQITGTRDERLLASRQSWTGANNNEAVRRLFRIHNLALAIAQDGKFWALGTTPAKATSTLRRRQKMAMMNELNL